MRRVEASVVYVGGPSVSEVLLLVLAPASSPTATAWRSPQTFDTEYTAFLFNKVWNHSGDLAQSITHMLGIIMSKVASHPTIGQAPTFADDPSGHTVSELAPYYWRLHCSSTAPSMFAMLQLTFLFVHIQLVICIV